MGSAEGSIICAGGEKFEMFGRLSKVWSQRLEICVCTAVENRPEDVGAAEVVCMEVKKTG